MQGKILMGTPELSRDDLEYQEKKQINEGPVVSECSPFWEQESNFLNKMSNIIMFHTNKSFWQITQFHVYMNLSPVKG